MDLGRTNDARIQRDHALGLDENLNVRRDWEKEKATAHKRMICSRCCVERGTEGEVWCLGCLGAERPS